MPGLTLPDLDGLAGTRDDVLGAFDSIAGSLPVDAASVTAGLSGPTATLNVSLQIDGAALTGGLSGVLEALNATVPGGVPAIEGLGVGLARALGAIEPIKQTLASGGELLDIRAFAFEQAGDPADRVAELLGQLSELIPADGLEALQTFVSTVTAFEASIPSDPAEVATFIGRGFLGVPADLLVPARSALDDLLGGLDGLVSPAQLDALPVLAASLVAELDGLQVQVAGIVPGDPTSYTASLNALASFQANLEAFATALSSLAGGLETGIGSLDAGALLGPIEAALAAIPDLQVPDTNAFVEIVLEPLRRVSALADTATPEQVAVQLRGWSGFIEREFAAQGAADLDAIIRRPFEEIGNAIEGMHLEAIREAFGDALAAVTSAVAPVTGAIATLREAVVAALDAATAAIDAVTAATGPVQDALQTLTSAVESAAGAVSLQGLRDDALVVIQELSGGVADFVESASAAVGTLHQLVADLGEVDLERSASGAIDLIQGITDTLSAIDIAPLPDALLDELRSALNGLLGSISLEPLKGTLDGVIDAVPFEELESFSAGFDDVVGELEQFSPSGLLEPLVAPFNEIVGKLTELRPGELLDPVVEQLEAARTELDGFEPAALLAPLDGPLQEVRTALEAIAPQVLLAPLHGPFDELMDLVERLDAGPILDELDTLMFEWMEEGLSGLAGLGEPFEGAAGTRAFVDQISGTGAIGGEFGFRPGDVLRPVQDLYEKITSLLDTVPAAALVGGFEEIRAGLVETLDLLSPRSVQASLHGRLMELIGSLDVGADSDLLGDLLPRYAALTLAVDGIDPAAVGDGARSEHTQLARRSPRAPTRRRCWHPCSRQSARRGARHCASPAPSRRAASGPSTARSTRGCRSCCRPSCVSPSRSRRSGLTWTRTTQSISRPR